MDLNGKERHGNGQEKNIQKFALAEKNLNKLQQDLDLPYLLLDVRDRDEYDACHIITALNYPTAMLSRSVNNETTEMLAYKNQPGKIIVLYDDDERICPKAATTLVQRGYDNLFLLSGGNLFFVIQIYLHIKKKKFN
jgi:rhodanese-related sulfurtransferase